MFLCPNFNLVIVASATASQRWRLALCIASLGDKEQSQRRRNTLLFIFLIIFKNNQVWQDAYYFSRTFKYCPIKIISHEWVFISVPMAEASLFVIHISPILFYFIFYFFQLFYPFGETILVIFYHSK